MWKHTNNYVLKDIRNKYKDRLNDYMNVYIYENNEEMYRNVNKIEKANIGNNYQARTWRFTRIYENKGKGIVKVCPYSGNLYFSMEDLSTKVITHECGHAVLGYINRKIKEKLDIFSEDNDGYDIEELFCYMLGSIASQINEFIVKIIEEKHYEGYVLY